jgi:hypothetical protein
VLVHRASEGLDHAIEAMLACCVRWLDPVARRAPFFAGAFTSLVSLSCPLRSSSCAPVGRFPDSASNQHGSFCLQARTNPCAATNILPACATYSVARSHLAKLRCVPTCMYSNSSKYAQAKRNEDRCSLGITPCGYPPRAGGGRVLRTRKAFAATAAPRRSSRRNPHVSSAA